MNHSFKYMPPNQSLRKLDIFKHLSPQSMNKLENDSVVSSVRQDCLLISKGDQVSGIYGLVSGSLRVFSLDEQGREITLYELHSGEICILALNSYFTGLPYPAFVSVSSPEASVLIIPSQTYAKIYQEDQAARDIIFNTLSKTVFYLMNRVDELTLHSIDQRLINFIQRNIHPGDSLLITHEQLAGKIGSTREVVSRALGKLVKDGFIKTSRGNITRLS